MHMSRHERYMLTYRVPLLGNMSSISVNGGFAAAGGIKDGEVSKGTVIYHPSFEGIIVI